MMQPDDLDAVIDRWIRERPAPAAPAGFTAGVMARVRQQRWRLERYWDLAFNAAVAGGLLLVLGGIVGLVYLSGFGAIGRDAFLLFATGLATAADQIAPFLPLYAGGFVLTVSALGLWWWAES